ncbi:Zn-ribbon domain-containing OB-fold protein [Nocardia sp. NPDC052278]|uniref:Zn-ribbon domain-containing OB-fold protein n=1 Tax=unclassified Nocardia TaxID=2637762 RepID=UPI0036800287
MTQIFTDPPTQIPLVDYLRLGPEPSLQGRRCADCGAVYLHRRSACGACGHADFTTPQDLSRIGRVTAATVIHRAPKGVVTPFLSGVVALDGGGVVRATLTGPIDDPVAAVGRAARLRTGVVGTDSRGVEAVGFTFEIEELA